MQSAQDASVEEEKATPLTNALQQEQKLPARGGDGMFAKQIRQAPETGTRSYCKDFS